MQTAKNNILKKIRLALTESTPIPFKESENSIDVYQPLMQDLVIEFAEQFTMLQGKFSFCLNEDELYKQLNQLVLQEQWKKLYIIESKFKEYINHEFMVDDINHCDASITNCEILVARTGSIILSSQNGGRITSIYAPIHICIGYTSQMVYDHKEALEFILQKYKSRLPSLISIATGPSRTADIEKTLVVGVHGPKEVYCFLVDDLQQAS